MPRLRWRGSRRTRFLEHFLQVDVLLRAAVGAEDAPGVVAMAATETGVVYEGPLAAGASRGTVMTRDTIFPGRFDGEADHVGGGAAPGGAGKLSLEAPVPDIDPAIAEPHVLDGWMRPAGHCCGRPAAEFAP